MSRTNGKTLGEIFLKMSTNENHVFGVNTREVSATQDPAYSEGHLKRKGREAHNIQERSARKSPIE